MKGDHQVGVEGNLLFKAANKRYLVTALCSISPDGLFLLLVPDLPQSEVNGRSLRKISLTYYTNKYSIWVLI